MSTPGGRLSLRVWFHPNMNIPVQIDTDNNPLEVDPDVKIVELMDMAEDFFLLHTSKTPYPMEMQINVIWNTKDHDKALNPNDKVGLHFEDNDTFGVYGDIVNAQPMTGPKTEEEKIPVTILTGFLGSGKTTLLNYVLREQRQKKIAVIENELGEVSIDDALLTKDKMALAEKVVLMDNGCMCCTIRGDLIDGLKGILADIRTGRQIDQIMIETTGMADPVPIVRTFMSQVELTAELRLDAVISLADAKHLIGRLDDTVEQGKVNEAYQQIAFADLIILNKLDLVKTDEAIAVKDRIREINRYAKVLGAIKGKVRMEEICNVRAHDMCRFANQDIEKDAEVLLPGQNEGHGHSQNGGHGHGQNDGHCAGHNDGHCAGETCVGGNNGHGAAHSGGHGHVHLLGDRHDTRVNSFALVKEGEIHQRKLAKWMCLLGQLPPDKGRIFRIKSIMAVKDHPYKHVFHAVMDISDEDDAGEWAEGEKKICKIVFIGRGMDQEFLRKGWEDIFADDNPPAANV